MIFYKGFLRRYLWRKNWLREVKGKLNYWWRKLSHDKYDDVTRLFTSVCLLPVCRVDGGANIGFVTHRLKRDFLRARYLLIEPNEELVKRLGEIYFRYSNVEAYHIGLTDSNGTLSFYLNGNRGTLSFLERQQVPRISRGVTIESC
jgi:hypothetical protein